MVKQLTMESYPVIHLKSGNTYHVLDVGRIINATNAVDGQEMVLYTRNGKFYVREKKEFEEKFCRR